jgi:hypothetical protein
VSADPGGDGQLPSAQVGVTTGTGTTTVSTPTVTTPALPPVQPPPVVQQVVGALPSVP